MTTTTTTSNGGGGIEDDYKVVPVSKKTKFQSIPLFLPKSLLYDPKTNTVSPKPVNKKKKDDDNDNDDDDTLVLVPNAGYDLIKNLKKPNISCIACVGPYRTGKSLLLSRFMKDSKAFQVGPTLEGCTRGIWISTSALVATTNNNNNADAGAGKKKKKEDDETYTFVLDCEGAGDPLEGNDASNARIALTCILISSLFLFNNTGRPDRGSLQFLSYLNTIRKRIPVQQEEVVEDETTASTTTSSSRSFPAFLWVFRDFFLQLPKRKDTGIQYTLKEFMLERVLIPQQKQRGGEQEEDGVVDSLLSDFRSFDVVSVRQPQKENDTFTPEEMSVLDQVDWMEFDSEFRKEMEHVISLSLSKVEPFRLGSSKGSKGSGMPAKGPQFVSWCEHVLELVNSDKILPNIPDLQQNLLQSLADVAVEKAIVDYTSKLEAYLSSCPVYNEGDYGTLIKEHKLLGVAEELELVAESDRIITELSTNLETDIGSSQGVLLSQSIEKLKLHCCSTSSASTGGGGAAAVKGTTTTTTPTSTNSSTTTILYQIQNKNAIRSATSCDILARKLYDTFRTQLRANTTEFTKERFVAEISKVETTFQTQGRGPAVPVTLTKFFKEQKDVDEVFLERVQSIDALYQKTLEDKSQLAQDLKTKNEIVQKLGADMAAAAKQHQEKIEQLHAMAQREKEEQRKAHQTELKEAMDSQKVIEAQKIAALNEAMKVELEKAESKRVADLDRKKNELESFKIDAETRLAEEITAREERLKREEETHANEVKKLLEVADEKMTKEIMANEKKRVADKKQFNKEMELALHKANTKMTEEIRKREEKLRAEEQQHNEEMEKLRQKLHAELQAEVDRLEQLRKEEEEKYNEEIERLDQECRVRCTIM